eukprot:367428_1
MVQKYFDSNTLIELNLNITWNDLKNSIGRIMKCINLEKLSLENSGLGKDDEIETLALNSVQTCQKLKYINFKGMICHYPEIIHGFLQNKMQKDVILQLDKQKQSNLFSLNDNNSLTALANIKTLKLNSRKNNIELWTQNICKLVPLIKAFTLDELKLQMCAERDEDLNIFNIVNQTQINILPYCKSSKLFMEICPLESVNLSECNINKTIQCIMSSNKSFENLEMICSLDSSHFLDENICEMLLNDSMYSNDVFDQKANELAQKLLTEYKIWFEPFICINKSVMKRIGMKRLSVELNFDLDIHVYVEESLEYEDDDCWTVQCAWDKHIVGILEHVLRENVSDLCQIDTKDRVFYRWEIVLKVSND